MDYPVNERIAILINENKMFKAIGPLLSVKVKFCEWIIKLK